MGGVFILLGFVCDALYALDDGWFWMYWCGACMALGTWSLIVAAATRPDEPKASTVSWDVMAAKFAYMLARGEGYEGAEAEQWASNLIAHAIETAAETRCPGTGSHESA
jgi:hypothetical protein